MPTPDLHHSDMVSQAIQDVLNNIDLLRQVVKAKDKNEAAGILTAYDPDLNFNPDEIDLLWTNLTTGKMEMDAKGLVDYYNHLESRRRTGKPVRGTPPPGEWKP